MELREYWNILVRRAWILILLACITSVSAYVFSKMQVPIYRSTIQLNVIPARLDWGLQQTIKNLLRNYRGQIDSDKTAAEVIRRLDIDLTPAELRKKMTVSPIESDFLIQIDVDDEDPLIAQQLAQTTAEVFVENIRIYMLDQDKSDRVDVSIRDSALPGTLHKPKTKINTLAGAVFGLILGFVVIFVLEWLQADIIHNAREVERYLGVTVLGAIPTASMPERRAQNRRRRWLFAKASQQTQSEETYL